MSAGYVIEGLSRQVAALRVSRFGNPWHWLLATDPLRNGLSLQAWAAPVAVTLVLVALGLLRLARRDLR